MIYVIDTKGGWMIRCQACQWHVIPRNSKWTFNGNYSSPTFSPSINEHVNTPDMSEYQPDVESSVCHYVVSDGIIHYQSDCSHSLAGSALPMIPWDDVTIKYYASLGSGA